MNVLVVVTGSIAAFKACRVVSALVAGGHTVRCVATPAALRFVGAATLEGLTRQPVLTDGFAPGEALSHIDLDRWADVVLVCPASADRLNKMAAGIGDDLAGMLWLAHDFARPLLVAPAMNPAMWRHPTTQAALARLRAWGVGVIAPDFGATACGEVGEGRLAAPEEIVAATLAAAMPAGARPDGERPAVLVTAGGTREPIDGVRFLTNASTGATGAALAAALAAAGGEVTLLRAEGAVPAPPGVATQTFARVADLDARLQAALAARPHRLVVHAAAVSDFTVDAPAGKLDSSGPQTLTLLPGKKLLPHLKSYAAPPAPTVVGFKLTAGAGDAAIAAAVGKLFAGGGVDYVVHNDTATIDRAAGVHSFTIWGTDGPLAACPDTAALATWLAGLLSLP